MRGVVGAIRYGDEFYDGIYRGINIPYLALYKIKSGKYIILFLFTAGMGKNYKG
jgi:hypothetical protein